LMPLDSLSNWAGDSGASLKESHADRGCNKFAITFILT
jgi:hypothetical protein